MTDAAYHMPHCLYALCFGEGLGVTGGVDSWILHLLFCFVEYASRRTTMQAYCVKCRAKKEMKDAKAITMKNGKPATQGVCPTCGTKMFRIGKS